MRKVAFGVIRRGRGPRLTQLDLHNLIGAVVLGWALVVSASGFLLGVSQLAFGVWQYTDLAALRAQYAHQPPVDVRAPPAPVARVISELEVSAPRGWGVRSVIFLGTEFTTPRHYGVVMGGSEGLDARLLDVTLVDAATGAWLFFDRRRARKLVPQEAAP